MPRATPSVISTLRLAARLAEIFPIPSVRSGISMLKSQYHVVTPRGIRILSNSRLTLATCQPPPGPVPSSGTVGKNRNSDGLNFAKVLASGATQGFGVPPAASGPPGGGEMKSPEAAPTPAPIGIGPSPPKPPDVLGQHSSGSTVVHPITSITTREAIEMN